MVDALAGEARRRELHAGSRDWPSWDLTPRQTCDLELLMTGAFSPLAGFLTRADYEAVLDRACLTNGLFWPLPITLEVTAALAESLGPGAPLVLRDAEGVMLAVLHVDEVWRPDRVREAKLLCGTQDPAHPGVRLLLAEGRPWNVGGRIEGLQRPPHPDFARLRQTPAHLRRAFELAGQVRVVAHAPRGPMHREQFASTAWAAAACQAGLLIQPVIGLPARDDFRHYARVRCHQEVLAQYPQGLARLALLPFATRHAGARELAAQALVHRNHGASHLLLDADEVASLAQAGAAGAVPGIELCVAERLAWVAQRDAWLPERELEPGVTAQRLRDDEVRGRLARGEPLPAWFTFPAVERQLVAMYPPRRRQGFTVFFTGLSGSGKSTIANCLLVKLLERGGRRVTLLDGDVVRKHLSAELGFSKAHRDINIRRIGFVAGEITKNGGVAICAPIAPYRSVRADVRQMVEAGGGFILVHVDTPLEECERRDRKGLYAKARAGLIPEFTGISDPYERPDDAELTLPTADLGIEQAAEAVVQYLEREGYLASDGQV